jgi:UPF0716 family protein affecting phage T7 exclusion
MRFSFRWLFVAFLLDLFSLFIFADAFGALWTLAWVLGAILLGVYLIVSAGDTLQSLGGIMVSQRERIEAIKETPWTIIAAIFFMIPGLVSDCFALILLIPDLRRAVFKFLFKKQEEAPLSPQKEPYETQYEDITHSHSQQMPHKEQAPILIEGKWEEKK